MIFVLDNYDSFTYNLVQRLGEIDRSLRIEVARNDRISVEEVLRLRPERVIISPGPCTPQEAGISKALIRALPAEIPLLGVCLGHQCIAEVYGAAVVRAERLMHGKVSEIHHTGEDVFRGLPNPFVATRYHSLIVPETSLPDVLQVTAWTQDAGYPREVMAVRHRDRPVFGVQFHPESYLTAEPGIRLLRNFLEISTGAPSAR